MSPKPSPADAAKVVVASAYEPSGFFVARSALLPFAELVAWNDGLGVTNASAANANALDAAERLQLARAESLLRLRRALSEPALLEALLFASPELAERVPAWLAGSESDPKLDRTLARYFARAAGRETPFGLFAGISVGDIGETDAFRLRERAAYRRHTRLGMGYLLKRLSELGARPEVRDRLRYEASSTLHRAFGRIRFASIDLEQDFAKAQTFPVVDVESTPHLEAALARANGGATLEEIARAVATPGIELEDAREFARELVQNQILIPTWLPCVSGPEPFPAAIRALAEEAELSVEASELAAACETLAALDRTRLGEALVGFRQVAEATSAGLPGRALAERFQTDLVKPAADLCLGAGTLKEFLNAAELVTRTAAPFRDTRLEEFRRRFEARYEGRFVPLVEALDADLGIGYDRFESETRGELFEDLPFGVDPNRAVGGFDAFDRVRLGILTRALANGERVHELDAETLASFPERKPGRLPESFAVAARLGRTHDESVQLIAPIVIAPSAMPMLARFCHADPELEARVRAHVELEQARAGDTLLADVVHLPHAHVANILLRPVLRSYEITYQGKSGAAPERRLAIDDLYVGVENARVVLRSKRLDRRLSIRITNAHNFDGWWNLPTYRFFGALQHQDHGVLASGWTWGALDDCAFLPRIRAGNVVLARARWSLVKRELEPLRRAEPAAAHRLVQELRERLDLPRWLTLSDGDQRLPIDLDNPLSVEVFVHEIRQRTRVYLEEMLPAPDELVLSGPEGSFAAELVVPFLRRADVPAVASPPRDEAKPLLELARNVRSRAPGSDWLYVKVYAGRSQLTSVLELARAAIAETSAHEPWFFVPFADPEPHLRLRVHGAPRHLLSEVYPALERALAPSFESHVVQRLELGTYERELERYGGERGMELSERLFWADSEATAELRLIAADDDELGWQLALLGIDRLFGDFALELEERLALVRSLTDDYGSEFGATTATWRKVGDKYRRYASTMTDLLYPSAAPSDPRVIAAHNAFDQRSRRLLELAPELARATRDENLGVDRDTLLRSYAHMHAIRLLGDSVRWYELLIYDFLRRLYGARAARTGRPVPASPGRKPT